jgi:hypothetical protein
MGVTISAPRHYCISFSWNVESGFSREALGLQTRKPGVKARASIGSGKEDLLMILMLVIRLAFVGRLSALIVWTRKGQR